MAWQVLSGRRRRWPPGGRRRSCSRGRRPIAAGASRNGAGGGLPSVRAPIAPHSALLVREGTPGGPPVVGGENARAGSRVADCGCGRGEAVAVLVGLRHQVSGHRRFPRGSAIAASWPVSCLGPRDDCGRVPAVPAALVGGGRRAGRRQRERAETGADCGGGRQWTLSAAGEYATSRWCIFASSSRSWCGIRGHTARA